MKTPSLMDNNRFLILLIDDYSRMTWAIFRKKDPRNSGHFRSFKGRRKPRVVVRFRLSAAAAAATHSMLLPNASNFMKKKEYIVN
jgi:hypothetical protein